MKVTISSCLMSLLCGMVFLSSASPAVAQGTAQKFEPGKFPGMMVDEVVVPVPSEIFSVLDKLGDPNWKDELRKPTVPTEADRMELSLIFGSIIAEGFVAVQAQDKQAVEDIGRDVIKLSKSLGLSKAVSPHAQSILDAVKNEDWKSVRKELDQTQSTVRAEMDRMHDNDLAQCVSLGGWLRGTASVTSVVGKAYTEDRAELLNQPLLVAYFSKAVNSMSESAKGNTLISAISKGLTKIHQAMETKDGTFTPEKISTIHSTCEELLGLILQTKKGK